MPPLALLCMCLSAEYGSADPIEDRRDGREECGADDGSAG